MGKRDEAKTGEIINIRADRGYGFIQASTGGTLFFHASRVGSPSFEELQVGDQVEFLVNETPKGLMAIDILVMA